MKYSNLRKKTACVLSVFSLGMNSKAEKIEKPLVNQPDGNYQIEEKKLNEEISKNIEKKNNYKNDIAKLKIDTYIPHVSQKEKKQSMKSTIINLLVGLAVIGGAWWGLESLVSMLWQRIARGVHIKNSAEHKEMLKYLSELVKFTPSHVMGTTTRKSQDNKAKIYFVNNYDKDFDLPKIDNEVKKDNENVFENVIIFGRGDKNITIQGLGTNIKKLCIISGGCVKICKAPNIEFFYAQCSNLVINKEDIISDGNDSKLKEAILNIRNLSVGEGENNFSVIAYNELLKLIKSNGLLGGKKLENTEYKTMKGLISSNGFGKDNWFTIYSKENSNGNK